MGRRRRYCTATNHPTWHARTDPFVNKYAQIAAAKQNSATPELQGLAEPNFISPELKAAAQISCVEQQLAGSDGAVRKGTPIALKVKKQIGSGAR